MNAKSLSILKELLILGYLQGWNSKEFVDQKFKEFNLSEA